MKELLQHNLYPSSLGSSNGRQSVSVARQLDELLKSFLVLPEDFHNLSNDTRIQLAQSDSLERLLAILVEHGLLTEYQSRRIDAGTRFGLILGNYRVLDRLGAGGMSVVFRAEHIRMRKQVAIKVLPLSPEHDHRLLRRFMTEIRAVAQLQHPNIVAAIDAGEVVSSENRESTLHFFAMEYVPGQDLEEYIRTQGTLCPSKACDLMHQVASALAEAHKRNLVHRDIKPSNIQITPEGQAKLLDFGLARSYSTILTEPGTLLGTLDYMAPEQIQDAHGVDIRADLYGLGGVLYWSLAGTPPFPMKGNIVQELAARLQQQPPSIRAKRPDVPEELDQIIQKLMALKAEDRFPNPQAVMRALLPFLKSDMREHWMTAESRLPSLNGAPKQAQGDGPKVYRVLLVDDEPGIRTYCKHVLKAETMHCDEAGNGVVALKMARQKTYDLVILDINMPEMNGAEVCRRLREDPPSPNLKIMMASGNANTDAMAQMMLNGADDYITKPFSMTQLQSRVQSLLRLKEAQDRVETLNRHLLAVNHQLEHNLRASNSDLVDARNALVVALAKLVEHRANETGQHLLRLQKYVQCLSVEAARSPQYVEQLDENFIELLTCCAPLHDIGKVGLPDHILMKPGKLDSEERVIMQAHTLIGSETLQAVAQSNPSAGAFLQMAIDIARHHHERFDGTGYPDRLTGTNIPLAARLVAICDTYDALRSRRVYKPALSHNAALQVMNEAAGAQFDPGLMKVFQQCAKKFDKIFHDNPD
ncbi:MAG: protein kinase [Gemmataceae bacterium]|nr:protein kinase [Gemmataceae bacterium]